jgi:hypothetical protein
MDRLRKCTRLAVAVDPNYETLDEENNRDSPMLFEDAQRKVLLDGCNVVRFFDYYSTQWKKSSLKTVTSGLLSDEFFHGHLERVLLQPYWNESLSPYVLALPWVLVSAKSISAVQN